MVMSGLGAAASSRVAVSIPEGSGLTSNVAKATLAAAIVAGAASTVHGKDSEPHGKVQRTINLTAGRPAVNISDNDSARLARTITKDIKEATITAAQVAGGPTAGVVASAAIIYGVPLVRRTCDRRSQTPGRRSPARSPPAPLRRTDDGDQSEDGDANSIKKRMHRLEEAVVRLETSNNESLQAIVAAMHDFGARMPQGPATSASAGVARSTLDPFDKAFGAFVPGETTGVPFDSPSDACLPGLVAPGQSGETSQARATVGSPEFPIDVQTRDDVLVCGLSDEIKERLRTAGVAKEHLVEGPMLAYVGPGGRGGAIIGNTQDLGSVDLPGTFPVRFVVEKHLDHPPRLHRPPLRSNSSCYNPRAGCTAAACATRRLGTRRCRRSTQHAVQSKSLPIQRLDHQAKKEHGKARGKVDGKDLWSQKWYLIGLSECPGTSRCSMPSTVG